MNKSDPSHGYEATFFDRTGPEGAHLLRALGYAVVGFVAFLILFGALAVKEGFSPLLALPLALATSAIVVAVGLRGARLAGAAFAAFVAPSGRSTPSSPEFSYPEALAAKGDVAGALESYEAVIAETPMSALGGIDARVRAAELYARQGRNARRAAELLREVQRATGVPPGTDVFVSYRLMDLFEGPLADPRRALVELRRLIERYPGTDVAAKARLTITSLKSRLDGDATGT